MASYNRLLAVQVCQFRHPQIVIFVSRCTVFLLKEQMKSGPEECNFVKKEPRTTQAVPKLGPQLRHLSHSTITIDLTCTALVRGYMEGEIEH